MTSVIERIVGSGLGWGTGETSDPRTSLLLWALVRFMRPTVIVEAGTFQGHTALAMADGILADVEGHVWTCDTNPSNVMEYAEKLGLAGRITFVQKDFEEMLAEIPDQVSLAYLDAGPDNGGLRWRHFEAVRDKLVPGGIVVVDDVAGVWPHSDEFRKMASLYFPNPRGVAIWQKPF